MCANDADISDGMGLADFGGTYFIVVVGAGLALITVIAEYGYYKFKKPAKMVSPEPDNKKQSVSTIS